MKYIIFFFLVSTAAIVMPNMVGKAKQSPAETAVDSTKLSLDSTKLSVDSVSWFEANMDLYIQEDYFTFDPALYTKGLTKEAKEKLSLKQWLGSFTISDMFKEKNSLTIDFSTTEVTKIMYITKTFFVLTSYTTDKDEVDWGSTLLYDPSTNTLTELESVITYGIRGWILSNNDILECSRKQITQSGFKIEHGSYDVPSKKFVVEFVE
jgi:hypothetical protein